MLRAAAIPAILLALSVNAPGPVSAQAASCQVSAFQGVTRPGGASAAMRVVNNGEACRFQFWMTTDRQPFDSATISVPATNGVATATPSGAAYTPRRGFVGTDSFTVRAAGRLNGQIAVQVTVVAP